MATVFVKKSIRQAAVGTKKGLHYPGKQAEDPNRLLLFTEKRAAHANHLLLFKEKQAGEANHLFLFAEK
jgi:hypothetical protein